jgi:flagellar basal body-associated protein FliL
LTRTPEIALAPEQAAALAARISDVNRHYSLPVMKAEHVALIALAVTAVPIYAGIYMQVAARKAGHREAARENANDGAQVGPVIAATGTIEVNAVPTPDWFKGEFQSPPN